MSTVDLEDQEWQQVITALAMQNPLVVKIANQLRQQTPTAPPMAQQPIRTDGKEARHE